MTDEVEYTGPERRKTDRAQEKRMADMHRANSLRFKAIEEEQKATRTEMALQRAEMEKNTKETKEGREDIKTVLLIIQGGKGLSLLSKALIPILMLGYYFWAIWHGKPPVE